MSQPGHPAPVPIGPKSRLPIRRALSPLRRFLEIESASGGVLLLATAVALWIANSPAADAYREAWNTPFGISLGAWQFQHSLQFWVNDGLMAIFFFVVGLEIKRELVAGELSEWRKAALPVMGALGGMIAPALIYWVWHPTGPTARGWGVPMATDIAFVVGIMALFGRRVPAGLKIFLLALAIADDIGAVLVIAVVYTDGLSLSWLAAAGGCIVLIVLMRRVGVRLVWLYVLVGTASWATMLAAHVHPTVAGVILGLMTPAQPLVPIDELLRAVQSGLHRIGADSTPDSGQQRAILGDIAWTAREAVSPLERIERVLHPVVGFIIMPIFALANAGVAIDPSRLQHPVALAIATGLVLGKPLGIVTLSWLAVRTGMARLPSGSNWKHLIAAGCLGGIGFTMAIFIAGLAFPGARAADNLRAAMSGIFVGSILSAIAGATLLAVASRKPTPG